MRYPLDATKITIMSGNAEAMVVMGYDRDGKATGEPAVDEQGRKTWRLANTMVNVNGKLSTDETVKIHTLPAKLEPMKLYKPTGLVELSLWKGRASITADGLVEA